ncbi:MAG: SIS domain-containing protein [Promethearchaeota archaeon]
MKYQDRKARFLNTIEEISKNLSKNRETVNFDKINEFIDSIVRTYGNNNIVFIYGAGRSGFIGRCFAQRLMHLGIKSCFISDTITYRFHLNDLLVVISGSGETTSSSALVKKAKEIGGKIILLTGNPYSTIGKYSNLIIQIEGKNKLKAVSDDTLAPYTSLFDIAVLTVLDAIGGVLMKILGISESDIDKRHASLE